MNSNTNDERNINQSSKKPEIDWQGLIRKIKSSGKLILTICVIGAIVGIVIGSGIPKEYTASISLIPESSRRSISSGISELSDVAGIGINASSAIERDALFSLLYPDIIYSTPFLVRLFDVKVRGQKDTIAIPLSLYLKEQQKRPWWSAITSAPSRLMSWGMSVFSEKPETEEVSPQTDIFRLTREEAGVARAIASRIGIDIKKVNIRRFVTISVTMQDPLIAATVADTVLAHLKEYITTYRTDKARRMLDYTKKLHKEAQAEYYEAQEKYARHADVNQSLVRQTSRVELTRLQDEMRLALTTYNRMEKQVQAAEARVKKEAPVLVVIQPVQVPLTPSKPRIMITLAVCILLSGAGSISWVLFAKDFLRKLKRKRTPIQTDD